MASPGSSGSLKGCAAKDSDLESVWQNGTMLDALNPPPSGPRHYSHWHTAASNRSERTFARALVLDEVGKVKVQAMQTG